MYSKGYSYKNERKEVRKVIYINTIGKKSDDIINDIFRSFIFLNNPKIKKSNYGSFKSRKYSFLLTKEEYQTISHIIKTRFVNDYINEIRVLSEINNNNNIWIIDQVEF